MMKEKSIFISGTVEEVRKIIKSLIERYGKEARLVDVIEDFDRDAVVFV